MEKLNGGIEAGKTDKDYVVYFFICNNSGMISCNSKRSDVFCKCKDLYIGQDKQILIWNLSTNAQQQHLLIKHTYY